MNDNKTSVMSKERFEAFTDAVIAIIMTILVLELRVPEIEPHATLAESLSALLPLWPIFFAFTLSFLFLAINWVNHYYFYRFVEKITLRLLWLNILLLFFLCLIPFSASALGENLANQFGIFLYAANIVFISFTYHAILNYSHNAKIFKPGTEDTPGIGRWSSVPAMVLSTATVLLSFVSIPIALFLISLIPVLYFLPNRQKHPHKKHQ